MLLGWVVAGLVTGSVSAVANVWTKHKIEKKTDQQTAELKAQVNTLMAQAPKSPLS